MEHVRIDRRFRGPPRSGNGGYSCGLAARFVEGSTATVSLRAPPPLETPLEVAREDAAVRLVDPAGAVIAQAAPASLELEVPEPPSLADAEAATTRYAGLVGHVFPECFVCGPARREGDGLRIFAGRVRPSEVAALWIPDPSLRESQRAEIALEHVWAALDCPGYFASELGATKQPGVLARLTARVDRAPAAGERVRVLGWRLGREGRKHRVGTALLAEDGAILARAEGLWIELDPSAAAAFV